MYATLLEDDTGVTCRRAQEHQEAPPNSPWTTIDVYEYNESNGTQDQINNSWGKWDGCLWSLQDKCGSLGPRQTLLGPARGCCALALRRCRKSTSALVYTEWDCGIFNKSGNSKEGCDQLLSRWIEKMMLRYSPQKDS